jgi:hypothetical protein
MAPERRPSRPTPPSHRRLRPLGVHLGSFFASVRPRAHRQLLGPRTFLTELLRQPVARSARFRGEFLCGVGWASNPASNSTTRASPSARSPDSFFREKVRIAIIQYTAWRYAAQRYGVALASGWHGAQG